MKFIKKYLGVLLGLFSLITFRIFLITPTFLEAVYTNGIYRLIRFTYSFTLAYIPFPILYIFILLLIILLVNFIVRKKRAKNRWITLLNFFGWLLFIFYWSWGFNYARTDFTERAQIEVAKPDVEFLYSELVEVDSILLGVRREIQMFDTIALDEMDRPHDLQELINRSQVRLIRSLNQPLFATPRIRELKPSGSLLRIKTAGVYFPFVLEGHIDNGLHPIEKPYVMAHEMAHAYAFTDEGVCNFIGFMTCVNADNLFVQYSGWLEYQGYLFRALRRNFPEKLEECGYELPRVVVTDLRAIRERLDKYPSIAPKIRDLFYSNYLKAQGVKAGMDSYSQITRLAYSYKRQYGGYKIE